MSENPGGAYKIPTTRTPYPEGKVELAEMPKEGQELIYEPQPGELVHVLFWARYPDYDFIFGVPDAKSQRFDKEVGFFQLRDTRLKTVRQGFYLDLTECEELIKGFMLIHEQSRTNSPHLWKAKQS